MKHSYVYILTNRPNGVLYIGVTKNIQRRIGEHKSHAIKCFSSKYNADKLVYYEAFDNLIDAIRAEKNMKKWKRQWKIELIEKVNPEWKDLSEQMSFALV